MKTKLNHSTLEGSSLVMKLYPDNLEKLDIFLSNVDLNKNQQLELINIILNIHQEGYNSGYDAGYEEGYTYHQNK